MWFDRFEYRTFTKMADITITLSKRFQQLVPKLRRLSGDGGVHALNRATVRLREFVVTKFMGAGSTEMRRLARNTGTMERRTAALPAQASADGVTSSLHIDVPYASTHFTATNKRQTVIRPITGRFLTVPILVGANKRPPQPARAYARTTARGGVLYAVAGNGLLPIFSLRSSVTVPTRINIKRDIVPYARQLVTEELNNEIANL